MCTGIIYCYKSPSGRYYIGKTLQEDRRKYRHLFDSKKGSNIPFHRAIRKYGIDSFEYSVLFRIISNKEEKADIILCNMERFFIRVFIQRGYNLYNISLGGEGGGNMTGRHFSTESKMKMSIAHKGKKQSKETIAKRASSLKGKRKLTKEDLDKLAQGRKRNLKAVLQYSLDGKFIKRWDNTPSIPSTIASYVALKACLNGKNKTCAGYIWKYDKLNRAEIKRRGT